MSVTLLTLNNIIKNRWENEKYLAKNIINYFKYFTTSYLIYIIVLVGGYIKCLFIYA